MDDPRGGDQKCQSPQAVEEVVPDCVEDVYELLVGDLGLLQEFGKCGQVEDDQLGGVARFELVELRAAPSEHVVLFVYGEVVLPVRLRRRGMPEISSEKEAHETGVAQVVRSRSSQVPPSYDVG